jgi:hypothetical protein
VQLNKLHPAVSALALIVPLRVYAIHAQRHVLPIALLGPLEV